MQCPSSAPHPTVGLFSTSPCAIMTRRWNARGMRNEEKRGRWRGKEGTKNAERKGNKDGEMEEERERAWHYHRPRRTAQAIVDLAEHFNDSSLPRAFTALAVSRLGYRSVCTSKQLSNSKRTSRCLSINVRPRFLPRDTIFVRFLFSITSSLFNIYVMYFTIFFILDLLLSNSWDPIICLLELIFLTWSWNFINGGRNFLTVGPTFNLIPGVFLRRCRVLLISSLGCPKVARARKDIVPNKGFTARNDTNSEFNNSFFEIEIYILISDTRSRVHNIRVIRSATIVADGSPPHDHGRSGNICRGVWVALYCSRTKWP